MGFSVGALDKSVFSKNSYAAAIGDEKANGYAVVRITPAGPNGGTHRLGSTEPDPSIVGVMDMKEGGGLSFSIGANWKPMGGIAQSVLPETAQAVQGVYEKANNIFALGGISQAGTAFASKKIYQLGEEYLTIKIPMMVVDWKGEGQPILSSMLLAYYCLPTELTNAKQIYDGILEQLKQYLSNLGESGNTIEKTLSNLAQGTINYAEGLYNKAKQGLSEVADNIQNKGGTLGQFGTNMVNNFNELNDATTLRSSPVPVRVEIGNYFDNQEMVIENISFNFSKEMTRSGPLFVKFNLDLSTRKIVTSLSDIGLKVMNGSSRYRTANLTGL